MTNIQEPSVQYDTDAGSRLFEAQLMLLRPYDSNLLVVYSQRNGITASAKDTSIFMPEFKEADEERRVPLATICRMEYHLNGAEHPHVERIGKFNNVISLELTLEEKEVLEAGEVAGHVFNQVALRLERIYEEMKKYGKSFEISIAKGKRTIVTPAVIDVMKNKRLPQEIALLSDMCGVSRNRYSSECSS